MYVDAGETMVGKKQGLLPEHESYRFGSIAVYRRFVTLAKVQTALTEQIEDNVMGRPHRRLGEILVAHDWITEEQMKSILDEMRLRKA
jgi:hypothetical protein